MKNYYVYLILSATASRAIGSFDTQPEAVAFADKMSADLGRTAKVCYNGIGKDNSPEVYRTKGGAS
ncbi:MAG TPA: hypothetical protein VHS96_18395 [Bacteroidia bacterium]|nr:hypothetical protein [Bacteroidia bacterium]